MPANKVMGRFRWCTWTNWYNDCKADHTHVVTIAPNGLPPNFAGDLQYFRTVASLQARSRNCRVHVEYTDGTLRLQFCFRGMEKHRGIHTHDADECYMCRRQHTLNP